MAAFEGTSMLTRQKYVTRLFLTASAFAILLAVVGTYTVRSSSVSTGGATGAVSHAVPVTVRTLAGQKARAWSEFSGRLQAVDAVEIRPEVSGRITEVLFEDGQIVKAGDVLFVIDPRPYRAAVAHAEAALASAQANAEFAKTDRDRTATLVASRAVAQRDFDQRRNASRIADAAVQTAEADLARARLDLEHAHVVAPIAGRASRPEITVGNLVQAGLNAPLLTTIISNDAIYAAFEVDEQTYLESVRDIASRRDQERRIPVRLSVQGDKSRAYEGTIFSFDNRIDPASGTIRARAKFDNSDGALLPGMFVSVKLAEGAEREELLVPDRAVGSDQSRKFVYVVGADDRISYREVRLGKRIASQRIALDGLQAGDRVVIDGVQRVRPNTLVAVQEAARDGDAVAAR
jgi:membrane fusion protein, multidrug efflux system